MARKIAEPGAYRTHVLQDDLTLTARREATIIQDDLLNTYQLEP